MPDITEPLEQVNQEYAGSLKTNCNLPPSVSLTVETLAGSTLHWPANPNDWAIGTTSSVINPFRDKKENAKPAPGSLLPQAVITLNGHTFYTKIMKVKVHLVEDPVYLPMKDLLRKGLNLVPGDINNYVNPDTFVLVQPQKALCGRNSTDGKTVYINKSARSQVDQSFLCKKCLEKTVMDDIAETNL